MAAESLDAVVRGKVAVDGADGRIAFDVFRGERDGAGLEEAGEVESE